MRTLRSTAPLLRGHVPILAAKAGATERTRGREWMSIRKRVLVRDNYACVMCGHIGLDNQVDHIRPLEHGGTDAMGNLRCLCVVCHKRVTAEQASAKWHLKVCATPIDTTNHVPKVWGENGPDTARSAI